MILLKNGLINDNNKLIKKDILIGNDKIVSIEDEINILEAIIYDCNDKLIMPGFIDVHVHLREPGYENKETIRTGTMSAAKGGITTVMAMPNLNPFPDSIEGLQAQFDIINHDALIKVYPLGCITKEQGGKSLADIKELAKYVKAISDDGKGVDDLSVLEEAIILAKKYDLVVASHAEDSRGEYVAVRREIELAKKHNAKYHFCHMSTKESFEAIRLAQKEGFKITCEVSPHHLFLNEDDINENPNYKMNPPLSNESDRLATLEALLSGVASVIASDHAPHTLADKNKEYDKCANGIIGLETMIPLVYTKLIKTGIATFTDMVNWLVVNPAKIFGLPYGEIKIGSKADICVLDIKNSREYKENEILSKGHNSPFIGMKLSGFCCLTVVDGKVIYKGEGNE